MPLTKEELEQIIESLKPVITETASQAAAAHVTKRNQSFEEKLEQKFSQPKPTPVEEEPEKVTLTSRVNKQDETIKNLMRQLKDEKDANSRSNMRSHAESILLKNKANPELLKAAMAQLLYEDKLIQLDETGSAYFKTSVNGFEEKLSIEEGVSNWIKNSGKAFILQPTAQGAGLRKQSQRSQIRTDAEITQQEADEALLSALKRGNF